MVPHHLLAQLGMSVNTDLHSSVMLFPARSLSSSTFSGRIDVPNTQSYGKIGKFKF